MNLHINNKLTMSLLSLSLGVAFANAYGLQKVQKVLTNAKVDKSFFMLKVLPPRTFFPFSMVDKNGKAIDPNQTATLPNGKTITARDYFAQVNALEQKLNRLGYSLRSNNPTQELGSPAITPTELNAQGAKLKLLIEPGTLATTVHDKVSAGAPLKVAVPGGLSSTQSKALTTLNNSNLVGDQIHGLLVNPIDVGKASLQHTVAVDISTFHFKVPLKTPPPATESISVGHNKSWTWDYGNSWFGAYFDGSFAVTGVAKVPAATKSFGSDLSSFSATTNGRAGIKLFSDSIDVVTYNAGYSGSDETKQVKLNADVKVLGYSVWSVNKTVPNGYKLQDTSQIPLDVATPTLEFPVGPFTISGKFGALGSAGISYSLALYYSSISGNVTPFVTSSAYGQVGGGIDLGIAAADAGVGVNLTLLNDSLTIGANVGVGWLLGFYLMDEFYIDNQLKALAGKVYFFVHESECFGLFNQQQNFTIFNWGGIQDNSSWVDIRNIIPLDWKG